MEKTIVVSEPVQSVAPPVVGKNQLIVLINFMYFQVGLLVSIISALIPNIIEGYHLSYTLAAMLPFAFYIAYTFFCIPTGMANERFSPKNVLLFSFFVALVGALLFGIFPHYSMSIVSLFLIGSAMAVIQVSTVPLLRTVCGPENLAFHSTLNQLMYGFGAFLSPHVFSFFTTGLLAGKQSALFSFLRDVTPQHFEWISTYWLFALLLLLTLVWILAAPFPRRSAIEKANTGYLKLLRNRQVLFYFFTLMAYASCEQGIAVWMSKFFQDYFQLDPLTQGAAILSWYWVLLSAGCIAGLLLLKFFDSRAVLKVFTLLALVCFTIGLYGSTTAAKIAFPMVGLFESVMWPVILSLALNSVAEQHELVTGFLYTASVGGALGPFIVGAFSDLRGLQPALHYIYLPLLIVLSAGFWAKPLVNNKTN